MEAYQATMRGRESVRRQGSRPHSCINSPDQLVDSLIYILGSRKISWNKGFLLPKKREREKEERKEGREKKEK